MAAMVHLLMKPVTTGVHGTQVDAHFAILTPHGEIASLSPEAWIPLSGPETIRCQTSSFETAPAKARKDGAIHPGAIWCRITFRNSPYDGFDPIDFIARQRGWTVDPKFSSNWSVSGLPWAIDWTRFVIGSLILFALGIVAYRSQLPERVVPTGIQVRGVTLTAAYGSVLATGYALQTAIYGSIDYAGPRDSTLQFLLLALVIAPVIEELFYRGWMLSLLRSVWGDTPALLVSSGLFAAVHFWSGASVFYVFGVAAVLAAVKMRTNSISCCIVLHAAFNLLPLAKSFVSIS